MTEKRDFAGRVAAPIWFLTGLLAWDRETWAKVWNIFPEPASIAPPFTYGGVAQRPPKPRPPRVRRRGTLSSDPPGVEVPPIAQFGSVYKPPPPRPPPSTSPSVRVP